MRATPRRLPLISLAHCQFCALEFELISGSSLAGAGVSVPTNHGCSARAQRFSLGLDGKVVVITGASKGIGAAVARQFAAEGAHLHLVSRTESDLQEVKAEILLAHPTARCDVHALDLSAPGSVTRLWSELDSGHDEVHILVNNAGAIPAGDLLSVDEVRRYNCVVRAVGAVS
jgi:hypothetical protein